MRRFRRGERFATKVASGATWNEAVIYALVNGHVDEWFADIGDHLQAGQPLATIADALDRRQATGFRQV